VSERERERVIMVAPNFKKPTDTNPGSPTTYGAPDLTYAFDVLDATHPTDKIQASVIEGIQQTYNVIIKIEGSNIVARNANGTIISSSTNVSPAYGTATLQAGLSQGGHIYIGPGLYNINATLLVPSNTHVEADVNATIRGPATPNALAGLIKNSVQNLSAPAIGNSYIIIEGGTWDGNAAFDLNVPSTMTQSATIVGNIHLFTVAFAWVNRVRSINALGENIKIRSCDRSWVTNCYCLKARLDDTGSGRAGIMVTSLGGREAICINNIVDDSGGEAIGVNRTCDRVIVSNNICRVRGAAGRGYILLESVGDPTDPQIIRDCVISNNVVSSRYQCIHIRSSDGVVVANNSLTNVGAGTQVGEASGGGEGIRLVGNNSNITITGNYIHDTEYDGMLLTGSCRNLIISDNLITNVGRAAANAHDGIRFSQGGGLNYENVKVTDNLIDDSRGTARMRHGISFVMNGLEIYNIWVQKNQVYNQLRNEIHFSWDINERFRNQTRFLNNSGLNSGGKITNPFNNSHNEVGLAKASPVTWSFAAAPSASTAYAVVMSPISVTSTGGTGVSITVEAPGGVTMISGQSTLRAALIPVGWTINFGAFSAAPSVNVVAV